MNYRHAFHAGNFADVHKHLVLLALLEQLKTRPKPLFFLDTHAGRGWYDLKSADAQRGNEWREGIGKLRHHSARSVHIIRYLDALQAIDSSANAYAGSPALALHVLRPDDRLVFVEKDLAEAAALQQGCRSRRGVSVVHGDGYAALKTYLPPRENRGLVFIDPPFESEREYELLQQALVFGLRRWSNGIFAVWYPIKAGAERDRLHAQLRATGLRKLLALELLTRPADSPVGLNGSGMLIANPPWKLDAELEPTQEELADLLGIDAQGNSRVEWVVPE